MILHLRGLGDEVNLNETLYGPDGFGFPGTGTPISNNPNAPTKEQQLLAKATPYVIGAVALYLLLQVASAGKRASRGFQRAKRKAEKRAQLKAQLAAL